MSITPDALLGFAALDDAALAGALRAQGLGLAVDEARRVCALIGRDPTTVEARIFDTMWSEHCSYKSSRPVLRRLPTTGDEVLIGPGEDAGVVHLGMHAGERWCVVLAHESHNHPSQVMPVEGAATGIGGIVRDVFCMGAEVVGVLDALRFGDPHGPVAARVRDIAGGVVRGIMDYGNALGVPNLGGDVCFDPSFDDNCLVNVVAVGLCRERDLVRSRVPELAGTGGAVAAGELRLLLVGKPTDATGFGGAAFASAVLDSDHTDDQKGAVQVPDPFLKRVLFEATTVVLAWLRERGVPVGFKDLGAGGISCAAVEMAAAAGMGLDLDLDRESVDDPARAAEVIACAETQERFALIVPAAAVDSVLSIYNEDFELPALYPGAGARDVGRILDDDRFVLRHRGAVVCDLPASVVTAGIAYERAAAPPAPRAAAPVPPGAGDDLEVDGLEETLGRMLARPNLCSRAFIYRGYDGEVRGRAVVRPGEGDAGVIAPVPGAPFGLAMTVDGIPAYGQVDPYLAGAHAACEAMRNVVCAGAEPIALTDCLNYGNPEVPEVFGTFVAGVDGIADAARGIGRRHDASAPVPVVSGNVSFYNQSTKGRAVAPSPIVACAGRLRELTAATTLRIRRPGSALLLVGRRRPELGGSEIAEALWGRRDAPLPPLDFAGERRRLYAVLDLIESGAVLACHDIAAGGFLLALVEMLLGERATAALGARIEVDVARWLERPAGGRWSPPAARPLAATLFGEAPGYLLEIDAGRREAVREHLAGRGIAVDGPDGEAIWCGSVTETAQLEIDLDGRRVTVALEPLAATLAGSLAAALA